jgi:hypothetical protein
MYIYFFIYSLCFNALWNISKLIGPYTRLIRELNYNSEQIHPRRKSNSSLGIRAITWQIAHHIHPERSVHRFPWWYFTVFNKIWTSDVGSLKLQSTDWKTCVRFHVRAVKFMVRWLWTKMSFCPFIPPLTRWICEDLNPRLYCRSIILFEQHFTNYLCHTGRMTRWL